MNRLLAEGEKGGASLLIYREGLLRDGEPDDRDSESVGLEERLIWRALDEVYAEGVDYRPAVRFARDDRAASFEVWLGTQL